VDCRVSIEHLSEQELPEDLESMAPGPELATLLGSVDRAKAVRRRPATAGAGA
jgi:hypothetical protein